MAALLTWLNANPWAWALIAVGGRALIKWMQAGRPEGLIGLLKSIISFVPTTAPPTTPTPAPVPAPSPVEPAKPDILAIVSTVLQLFQTIRTNQAADPKDVAAVDKLESAIAEAAPALIRQATSK